MAGSGPVLTPGSETVLDRTVSSRTVWKPRGRTRSVLVLVLTLRRWDRKGFKIFFNFAYVKIKIKIIYLLITSQAHIFHTGPAILLHPTTYYAQKKLQSMMDNQSTGISASKSSLPMSIASSSGCSLWAWACCWRLLCWIRRCAWAFQNTMKPFAARRWQLVRRGMVIDKVVINSVEKK